MRHQTEPSVLGSSACVMAAVLICSGADLVEAAVRGAVLAGASPQVAASVTSAAIRALYVAQQAPGSIGGDADEFIAQSLLVMAESLQVHRADCKALGEPVHNAVMAAVRVGGPGPLRKARLHRAAGVAKRDELRRDAPLRFVRGRRGGRRQADAAADSAVRLVPQPSVGPLDSVAFMSDVDTMSADEQLSECSSSGSYGRVSFPSSSEGTRSAMQTGSKVEPSCSALQLVAGNEVQAHEQVPSETLAVDDELVVSDIDEADAADFCAELAVVDEASSRSASTSVTAPSMSALTTSGFPAAPSRSASTSARAPSTGILWRSRCRFAALGRSTKRRWRTVPAWVLGSTLRPMTA